MMIGTGANAEIYPSFQDPKPIIDIACPRSVGGINAAARLASAMNIPFKLHELDCEPFSMGMVLLVLIKTLSSPSGIYQLQTCMEKT